MSDDRNKPKTAVMADAAPASLNDSMAVTPVFANITNITTSGDVTRISFGETWGGGAGPRYHTAVVMPTQAALELATLIQQIVAVHQQRIAQEAEAHNKKGSLN